MNLSRRRFLLGASVLAASFSLPGFVIAEDRGFRRLVVVNLRGGLDGLGVVPVIGDRHFMGARGVLAEMEGVHELDGYFGLHSAMTNIAALYEKKEAIVFHAVAPPYRGRSHFDGQNVLESGGETPYALKSGWLYRALATTTSRPSQLAAMSIGANTPLILRGDETVGSWLPDRLPEPDDDTMSRVIALYDDDPRLAGAVRAMQATEAMLDQGMGQHGSGRGNEVQLSEAAAKIISNPNGPQVSVLESTGWDTHANQNAVLGARLRSLDAGIGALKDGLGALWAETAVLIVSEFGRTVAANGTRGTDHGVGGAAFLLGGSVNGGQVVADWPGLSKNALHDGRDLRSTLDLRALGKSVLVDHLGADGGKVDQLVFPHSTDVKRVQGLFS
ncbi:MAG: DUF1501 domain-containing protein [Pseudomonadota bacterium]